MAARALRRGDSGKDVKELQDSLVRLGYQLPRFGADGVVGGETISAVEKFKRDRALGSFPEILPTTISLSIVKAILNEAATNVPPPPNFFNVTQGHNHSARSATTPWRKWKDLTGITIHQTATNFGENPTNWQRLDAHLGVTRNGKIIQVYEFTEVVNHANLLNFADFGIEFDGWYEGIEGKIETLWQPPPKPGVPPRKPTSIRPEQIAACRAAVEWICATVAANGGEIKYIHPHRQASKKRRSDPGSRVWKDIGIWAQDTIGLRDGGIIDGRYVSGKSFKLGTGYKIPGEWDPDYPENKY